MITRSVFHALVAVLSLALASNGGFLESFGQVGPPPGYETLDIMASLPLTGSEYGESMALGAYFAADLINRNTSLLPGHWIVLHVIDDQCDNHEAVQRVLTRFFEDDASYLAIGGLGCSATAKSVAPLGDILRVPVVSWGASLSELSNRALYPRFFRTRMPEGDARRVQVFFCKQFKWRNVALIKADPSRFSKESDEFKSLAASHNITVLVDLFLLVSADAVDVISSLLRERLRVVMMYTYEAEINLLMCASIKEGGFGFVLLSKITVNQFWLNVDSTQGNHKCTANAMQAQLNGHVQIGGVSLRPETGVPWGCFPGMKVQDIANWWENKKMQTGLLKSSNYFYNALDGVCLMAKALAGLLAKNNTLKDWKIKPAWSPYLAFTDMIASVAFEGASGRIEFPAGSGDPAGKLMVKQMVESAIVVLGSYDPGSQTTIFVRQPTWPGGKAEIADSFAACSLGTAPNGSACSPCEVGMYKAEVGNGQCTVCPMGWYSKHPGQSKCIQCAEGLESNVRYKATGCVQCKIMYNSRTDEPCEFDKMGLIPAFILFCLISMMTYIVCMRVRYSVKISDITPCHDTGNTRVTVTQQHQVDYKWRNGTSTRVSLHATGCNAIDGWDKGLRAKVVGNNTFELIDKDGQAIQNPELESSKGYLMIPLVNLVLDTRARFVKMPAIIFIIFCLTTSVITLTLSVQLAGAGGMSISCCGFLLGLICAAEKRRGFRARPRPIDVCIRDYRKRMKKEVPAPVSRERGPGRAVSIESLQLLMNTFDKFLMSRNMYYLCPNIVLPVTEPYRLSLAEVIGPKQATWFVSHFWGTKFRDTIASLNHHAEFSKKMGVMECNYWVCTISNNQWDVKSEMGEGVTTSSFYLSLESDAVRGTAMIVNLEALPLERVWCLFEASITCEKAHVNREFKGLLLCTPAGVLNAGQGTMETGLNLATQICNLDMRNAKATRQEDKDMILKHVESMEGGLEEVNRFVVTGIQNSLTQMHTSFEKDFDLIMLDLVHRTTIHGHERHLTSEFDRAASDVPPNEWDTVASPASLQNIMKTSPKASPLAGAAV